MSQAAKRIIPSGSAHQAGGAASARMDTGIELIRIVACFMVVLLHVAASGFHEFGDAWWPSNVYDACTRVCVPLFLMVTGALLLGRQEPLVRLLRGRLLRLLPPLLFWSLFYLGWRAWRSNEPFDWLHALASLPGEPSSYHLWYLYAMIGITLFVPFLRLLWQHASAAEKRFYLLMWLLVSGLPMWGSVLGWETDPINIYELSNFFGLAGYLFLGAWLQDVRHGSGGKASAHTGALALFGLGSVATLVATAWLSHLRGAPDVLFYDYLSPFVILAAAGAYLCLAWVADRCFAQEARRRLQGTLMAVSTLTLGIYCIHISWLEWVMDHVDWQQSGAAAWWMMPVTALLVFAVSAVSVRLLRQVRVFRYVM